jgi:GST-like protein
LIQLHASPSPEACAIAVMLEETGLAYEILPHDAPLSIVDDDVPLRLAGAGAILIYLAERTGRMFPVERRHRYPALQWLMFEERDGARLCAALEARLGEAEFLAGVYSIADIAAYAWVAHHAEHGPSLQPYPALRRWAEAVGARPAVQRGMAALRPAG